jgi:ketosteroid isomerase-like protein
MSATPTHDDDAADRLAITQVVQRYGTAIDAFDYDTLATLFTSDASVEYGGYPEMTGGAETAAWLRERSEPAAWQQHLVTVMDVRVDGDEAMTLAYVTAHAVAKTDSETVRVHVGEYRDRLRRTSQGWRICERRQKTGWKEVRTRAPL